MITFEELLKYPVEKISNGVYELFGCYYNHVPELEEHKYYVRHTDIEDTKQIFLEFFKDFCFDGRRVWQLYSVKFDNELVMLCKNAGREGDDHEGRVIFNEKAYKSMVVFLLSFTQQEKSDIVVTNLKEDARDFYSFYNNTLDDKFERW